MKLIVLTAVFLIISLPSIGRSDLPRSMFHGFPVFPSSRVPDGKELVSERLDLPLPSLEALNRNLDQRREVPVSDWLKLHEDVYAEMARANAFFPQKAKNYGWVLTIDDEYSDGGSKVYVFARLDKSREKIQYVSVSIMSSMRTLFPASDAGGVRTGRYEDDWGTVIYGYEEIPSIPAYREFPLNDSTGAMPAVEDKGDGEVVIEYPTSKKPRGFYGKLAPDGIAPCIYGWEPLYDHSDPPDPLYMDTDSEYLFKRDYEVARFRQGKMTTRITFLTGTMAESIFRKYGDAARPKPGEVVDCTFKKRP